jgi:hypothetical protein
VSWTAINQRAAAFRQQREAQGKLCLDCLEFVVPGKSCCQVHLASRREYDSAWNARLKAEVLAHYGKDSKLQCVWPECEVTDPDMLTLDHIDNDGAKRRKLEPSHVTSPVLRSFLKTSGFPSGYQTLCHNHQWKKELSRRRDSKKT